MNKTIINVPKGINFLSDWKEFNLPNHPHILNKQITGCGFTQWTLTCPMNIILCSPRRILLENKESWFYKNSIDRTTNGLLYYAKNEYEKITECDKDTSNAPKNQKTVPLDDIVDIPKDYLQQYKQNLRDFVFKCQFTNKFCKILVTYDSYRKIKEVLEELKVFDKFYIVVDEMQSIFTDSSFKSTTELEFVNFLQETNKICYASATPMMDKYLDMLEDFKDLPYYELDWGADDPTRITQPKINKHECAKVINEACEIIKKYKTGDWKDSDNNIKRFLDKDGNIKEIQSKEAVFYMNSVKNICDIIKLCNLKQEECNILCANNSYNSERIRKAFGVSKKDFQGLGKVPDKDDMNKNKMFTLCTRTVYLGADFYSTNARSFVFSDANSRCLTIDIALDLPQILGRQRYEKNPWKDCLEFYYIPTRKDKTMTEEDFIAYINNKESESNGIIRAFKRSEEDKDIEAIIGLANTYRMTAKTLNYNNNYVAVNQHGGSYPILVFNNYVMISELRSYHIAQGDYISNCYIRSAINRQFYVNDPELKKLIDYYQKCLYFTDKMKFVCEYLREFPNNEEKISFIVDDYVMNYFKVLGPEKVRSLSYARSRLDEEVKRLKNNQSIDPSEEIYDNFQEGNKYSKAFIKNKLKEIYLSINFKKTAKASDLEEWFEVRPVNYMDNGKKVNGFEIIKKK